MQSAEPLQAEAPPSMAMLHISDVGPATRRLPSPASGDDFSQLHVCDVDSSFSAAMRQTVLIGAQGGLAAAERVVIEREEEIAHGSMELRLGLVTPCEVGAFPLVRGRRLVLPDKLGDEAAGLRFHLETINDKDSDVDPRLAPMVLDIVLMRSGRVLTEVVLAGPISRGSQLTEEESRVLHAALRRVRAAMPIETFSR
jgi:hypothetical protein